MKISVELSHFEAQLLRQALENYRGAAQFRATKDRELAVTPADMNRVTMWEDQVVGYDALLEKLELQR